MLPRGWRTIHSRAIARTGVGSSSSRTAVVETISGRSSWRPVTRLRSRTVTDRAGCLRIGHPTATTWWPRRVRRDLAPSICGWVTWTVGPAACSARSPTNSRPWVPPCLPTAATSGTLSACDRGTTTPSSHSISWPCTIVRRVRTSRGRRATDPPSGLPFLRTASGSCTRPGMRPKPGSAFAI